MIQIDGLTWDVACEIHRVSEVTPSEISGMLLDKMYFNDVLGTYLRYEIGLAVPQNRKGDYDQIYERLTAPEPAHSFVLPYGQDTVEITGRVANVQDTLYKTPSGNYWEGCRFTVIANHPTKTQTLNEAIRYGLPPWPQSVVLPIGSVWEYTADGWERYTPPSYPDADERYY